MTRCTRCHRSDRVGPCLLCRPDLVSAHFVDVRQKGSLNEKVSRRADRLAEMYWLASAIKKRGKTSFFTRELSAAVLSSLEGSWLQ